MADQLTEYGFEWGPMTVTRMAVIGHPERGRMLQLRTGHAEIDVYVSPQGRSIRIFKNGKELKEGGSQ